MTLLYPPVNLGPYRLYHDRLYHGYGWERGGVWVDARGGSPFRLPGSGSIRYCDCYSAIDAQGPVGVWVQYCRKTLEQEPSRLST